MAWVRLDETFAEHPKVAKAGPLGLAMHVAALCYCNRHLTDGFVPKQIARTLLDFTGLGMRMWDGDVVGGGQDAGWELVVDDLVDAGMWVAVDGGWHIHDYLDYQPSRQQVQELKETRQRAGRAGGKAKAQQTASKRSSKTEAKSWPDTDTEKKYSAPNGAGADAPIPLGFLKPIKGDWKALLFGQCLEWLASVYGQKPGSKRGLLGKWLSLCSDDAEKLVGLIAECQRENRADPKAWITACLQESRDGENRNRDRPNKAERAKAAVKRAAVAGGYAGPRSGGETGAGDDAISVLPKPETVRKRAGGT